MSNEIEIPPELAPLPPEDRQVATSPSPVLGRHAKAISQAFHALGLTSIPEVRFKELENLGLEINPASMIRSSRAGAMIAQHGLIKAFGDLIEMMDKADGKTKIKYAGPIAMLAGKINAVNRQLDDSARKEKEPPTVPASPGGRQFIPHIMVQVQSPNPTKVKLSEIPAVKEPQD